MLPALTLGAQLLTMLPAELQPGSSSSANLRSVMALRCSSSMVTITWLRLLRSLMQVAAVWRFSRTCCTSSFMSSPLVMVTFCSLYLTGAAA